MMAGVGTGAVIGTVQAAQAAPGVSALQTTLAPGGDSKPIRVAELVVEDADNPTAGTEVAQGEMSSRKPSATRAPVPSSASAVYAPMVSRAPAGSSVDCAQLDDKKIYWLLDLVAKAKASNPDQAAVADHVDAQLRAKLGQNICAEEAQIYINAMCGEPGVRNFMDLMVKELPFFVRPMVGDPCSHDLVAAADKWL
ncbi:MAG: hypothetical protein KY393_03710 [Actinobacteria bacterium]|nr:hypothetical protein [Actinomycetota bacterium]